MMQQFSLLVLSLLTIFPVRVHSNHEQTGQCPLKVPSKLSTKSPTQLSKKRRPGLVTIAHRGASFSLPEHTLPAYRLALELGTDYIEPDLVGTKDGKLIAIHNIDLNITTNVAQVYPDRHRTIVKDREQLSGYFAFDFTLEEVKALRVKQRIDGRSQQFDWNYPIPTLNEILDLLYEWNSAIHPHLSLNETRKAGLYAEVKSPEVYLAHNMSLADMFIDEMKEHPHGDHMFFNTQNQTTFGCEKSSSYQVPPLVVQCFHPGTLQYMNKRFVREKMAVPPFVLLVDKRKCSVSTFWYQVGTMNILSGIGPDKQCLTGPGGKEFMIESKKFNLAVHPWTAREEMGFVTSSFGSAEEEMRYLYCKVGISGMFTENVDLGVKVGVRGCDDFISAEELLEEDIVEIEEEDEGDGHMNGTISKEICQGQESKGNGVLRDFASIVSGIAIGMFTSLLFSKKMNMNAQRCEPAREGSPRRGIPSADMRGMRSVATEDNEII